MARTARLKLTDPSVALYHLMSRTNAQRFLFNRREIKDELVSSLKRAAAFCGIDLNAYTMMDNHFHIVCKVTRTGEPVTEEEVIRRYAILKGAKAAERLRKQINDLRLAGCAQVAEEELNRLRVRMNDISEFIKLFKEMFNVWYKAYIAKHTGEEYSGSIWNGRFKSTLIQDGKYLHTCCKYVYYNPIRAGIVHRAHEYAWSWIAGAEGGSSSNAGTDPAITAGVGSVPEEALLRRVVQIGAGKVFGDEEFVKARLFGFGGKLKSSTAVARPVGQLGFASHGYLLAKKLAAKLANRGSAA